MFSLIWLAAAVWALSVVVSALVFLFYGLAAGLSRPRQRRPAEAGIGPALGVLAFGVVLVTVDTDYWWTGAVISALYLAGCLILCGPARALGRRYARWRLRRYAA